MTTDISGPEGSASPVDHASRAASAIADAQGVRLGKVIPLKIIVEQDAPTPGNGNSTKQRAALGGSYDAACAIVAEAMQQMAEIKNIAIPPQFAGRAAPLLVDAIDPAMTRGLVGCEARAVGVFAATVNRLLDIYAAASFLHFIWRVEGFDQLDDRETYEHAQAWMCHQIANDTGDHRYRWPDTADMAIGYFRARSRGPVRVTMPAGQIGAAYFLDGPACRRAASAKGMQPASSKPCSMPIPLAMRCPGLIGTPGARMPDGRAIHTQPDGTVCTTWWRGGVLHRDPKDGPAWHRVGPSGERSEYAVEGRLHRDHADGPAIIDTNLEGREISSQEYYKHGELHRPATEGPALLDTDRSGRAVRELYYEHGKLHRDPIDGPAWRTVSADREVIEYHVNGELHRDHRDGPAVIDTNIGGKNVTREDFLAHGQRHRPSAEGPALVEYDRSGRRLVEVYAERGELHRDPQDGPARWEIAEEYEYREYHMRGVQHCDENDGPAYSVRHIASGVVTMEHYIHEGVMHRDHGPAWIDRDPETGVAVCESWSKDGEFHRDDGPAVIMRDPTGAVTREEFWRDGQIIEQSSHSDNRRARRQIKSRKRHKRRRRQMAAIAVEGAEAHDG